MLAWMPILAAVSTTVLDVAAGISGGPARPEHLGLYYSGPPCAAAQIDRTFSQFQVNLAPEEQILTGTLRGGPGNEAVLELDGPRDVDLVSNASRADWLLAYPYVQDGAGVLGRPTLRPDCSVSRESFYVEALFPRLLLDGSIEPRLDLMRRPDAADLQEAVRAYRGLLKTAWSRPPEGDRAAAPEPPGANADRAEGDSEDGDPASDGTRGAAARLRRELFAPEAARALMPWRVRLLGSDRIPTGVTSVDILLSGADGSTGMFGHIAVGSGGMVYNIYPKGSDRGGPEVVPLADYLFNTVRGQALRRPTWLLRLQGLPADEVAAFDREMRAQIDAIREGRSAYHPTANNCTVASLRGLTHLGMKVSSLRYFTRRFPRPAFDLLLERLPHLVDSGDLPVCRVELLYIPQVPDRPTQGGAPNRPLHDRSKILN